MGPIGLIGPMLPSVPFLSRIIHLAILSGTALLLLKLNYGHAAVAS